MNLESYVQGRWQSGTGTAVALKDATTGEPVAYASSAVSIFAARSSMRATWAARRSGA